MCGKKKRKLIKVFIDTQMMGDALCDLFLFSFIFFNKKHNKTANDDAIIVDGVFFLLLLIYH